MADEMVTNLLAEWDFENLIQVFKDQEIDHEAFLHLTEDLIKEIIPIIGTRVKFLSKFKNYQMIYNAKICFEASPSTSSTDETTVEINNAVDSLSNAYKSSKRNFAFYGEENLKRAFRPTYNLDLKEFLQLTTQGRYILNYYSKEKTLCRKTRNLLVEILIKEAVNDCKKLTSEDFDNLSLKICDLFPTETIATYYIPYVGKENSPLKKPMCAKGKLVDKYRNIQRLYKIINDETESSETQEGVIPEEQRHSVDWLKDNTEPWNEVILHWQVTYNLRKLCKKKTVSEFITEWPILKINEAQFLIEEDFNVEYSCGHALLTLWEKCFRTIENRNLTKHLDKENKELLSILNSNLSEDSRVLIQFYILASLLPPTTRIRRQGINWKPSVGECKENFIGHVKTVSDVHIFIDERKERLNQFGLKEAQLYVLVVGPSQHDIGTFYVIIDQYIYKVKSLLKAIDICFKAFRVLHAKYPVQCEQLWLFLQKTIYEINTPADKRIPVLDTFIADLGNWKKE